MARILVIDNDLVARDSIRSCLQSHGHLVVSAANGTAGLKALNAGMFDLILTEVLMPEMDGLEIIIHTRRHNITVPVIAMAAGAKAMTGMDVLKYAKTLGASAVLEKPFADSRLLDMIDNVLASSR